jgi:hypothetical protein
VLGFDSYVFVLTDPQTCVGNGVWITLRAARIGDGSPDHPGDIAVTIEHASPAERLDIFSRAFAARSRRELLARVLG